MRGVLGEIRRWSPTKARETHRRDPELHKAAPRRRSQAQTGMKSRFWSRPLFSLLTPAHGAVSESGDAAGSRPLHWSLEATPTARPALPGFQRGLSAPRGARDEERGVRGHRPMSAEPTAGSAWGSGPRAFLWPSACNRPVCSTQPFFFSGRTMNFRKDTTET